MPFEIVLVGLIGLFGLAVGSFLNVVIWRVPRGESVVHPASACPRCDNAIRARDNIPVLSWLLLRGRCRDCGEPIALRYPAVELATGLLFVLVTLRFGLSTTAAAAIPAFLFLAAIGVSLSLIDLDVHRLPNAIVLPSYPVSLVLLTGASVASGDYLAIARGAIGGVALFSFYFLLAVLVPRGMGFGDVKLAGLLGLNLAWLGWGALGVGAFAAFLIGGVWGILLLITRRARRKSGIPFGPSMIIGAAVGIFYGDGLAVWYLGLVGLA